MNSIKFEVRRRGLNSALRKVMDATPMAEAWNAPAIGMEMRRLGTGGADMRTVLGCLNSLVDIGLVEEVERGLFRQIKVKEAAPKVPPCEETPCEEPACEEPEPSIPQETDMRKPPIASTTLSLNVPANPIDKLAKLATRLRDLANDMENAALELAEQAEKNEHETAQMRQLQALLKSLG